ncbi:hypothetical protein PR202_ga17755 [Eleusine coracana subsp. coracana]|uniref:Peptidase S9 prolyl oligopeptidase catalytic domain-containing protein n=1 Tax=Eleusine coracana subsp. coracana TaxID=191504 RepID=A0AAV5CQG5_ELECO|nr:hypothetical protein PR202_ga17508 [Eleusine coracana subsp. coracana]GJN00563.1 hypothetical protein PR202_ga17755 [Eleusine coracana subsp. coracana]
MHPHASPAAEKATAPYGSWESPITAAVVSAAGRTVEGLAVSGDGRLVWVETRPEEGGRAVLVKEAAEPSGEAQDVTPQGFAVRSLAQEYGGGAFRHNSPLPLTPDYAGSVVRYADGVFDPHFNRFITIMEDHRDNSSNPVTTVVAVTFSDESIDEPTVLVSGNDFYAFPRVDPTEKRMAWIEWSNPNMSWDKSELWIGYFSEKGKMQKRICIAGGDSKLVESPTEPKWSSKAPMISLEKMTQITKLFAVTGGPTDEARGILDLSVQYWTSRGWAFVDVNYGGSSGYGREYRERLLGQWGIVDVNDCCSCATFLVVSPDQATKIYKAIKDKGLPVALIEYEGEQHGFRKAENIKFTLEQAMVFFARLVGRFKVADDITPIKIENFD